MVELLLLTVLTAPPEGLAVKGKVVEVYDGDTVTVEFTIKSRVRVIDLWCPEVRGVERPEGLKSKKRMEELVLGREVLVHVPAKKTLGKLFSFDRLLAHLYLKDKKVSEQMIEEGFGTKER